MTSPALSPGPFKASVYSVPTGGGDYDCGASVLDANGREIAYVLEIYEDHADVQDGNVALLAASFELRSTLQAILANVVDMGPMATQVFVRKSDIEAARAALSRALGSPA